MHDGIQVIGDLEAVDIVVTVLVEIVLVVLFDVLPKNFYIEISVGA